MSDVVLRLRDYPSPFISSGQRILDGQAIDVSGSGGSARAVRRSLVELIVFAVPYYSNGRASHSHVS